MAVFSLVADRMHVRSPTPGPLRAVPVRVFDFDLLHVGAEPTLSLPYTRRRELLEALGLDRGEITAPPAFTGDGTSVQAAAEKLGLEGVVAKRLTSTYQPDTRTPCLRVAGWLVNRRPRRPWRA
jgi:bifunctional non-homologous end joining protein LigD